VSTSITFIGAGNMAAALINGLLADGFDASTICAADPDAQQLAALATAGVSTTSDNAEAIAHADIVVVAVKPQVLAGVVKALPLQPSQLVVSIAAGVSSTSLQRWTSDSQPIVRCMPNTPALLGAGITALFANEHVSAELKGAAQAVLSAVGKTIWVDDESMLDAVTALSGSGPAYFFYLMEAMIKAGEAMGLSTESAALLTVETAHGAARMAREGGLPPDRLRQNVTSPGGTTQKALSILDEADCTGIIGKALAGARDRSEELAKEFGA
tara:strand:- start:9476 stop:10285 length:810 start_codon:yes stop_codon:yes gene_type:complete